MWIKYLQFLEIESLLFYLKYRDIDSYFKQKLNSESNKYKNVIKRIF